MKTFYILFSLLLSISLLAKNVATITAIRGTADIQRAKQKLHASLGQKLQTKDVILTKENAKLQVIFNDETIISIGKNSEFSIEDYLFEDNQIPVAKFGMIRGAIRTITGKIGDIAPQKFSVVTKTATIGIRGTNFSIFVNDDGSSSAFCTFGAISVAVSGATYIVQQGFFLALSPSGKIKIKEFTPELLKEKKEQHFDPDKVSKQTAIIKKDVKLDEENKIESGNNAQLDVTIDDNSGLIVTNVSDTVTDSTLQDNITNSTQQDNKTVNTPDLSTLLAGYTMTNAQYAGTYTVTQAAGGDAGWQNGSTGNMTLDIDFGNDTAKLSFTSNTNNAPISVDGSGVYGSSTFSGTGFSATNNSGNTNSFSGTFSGATGQNVSGNFDVNTGGSGNDKGTYSATTSQTLH